MSDGKPKKRKEEAREIILIERTDEYKNEITVTRQDISVTVTTVENSERTMEMIKELMDKYGNKKK